MPNIAFIKHDTNTEAQYRDENTVVEYHTIRNALATKQGLLEALALARYNTKLDHINDLGPGCLNTIRNDAEKFKLNATGTAWTFADVKQERILTLISV